MKNKEITMLELFKLIAEGNPPKKIRWNYTDLKVDKIYIWYDWAYGYYEEGHPGEYKYRLLAYRNEQFFKILNSTVEILPEKNDEWEDIEEFEIAGCNVKIKIGDNETFIPTESLIIDYVLAKENQLIKNQRHIIKIMNEILESEDEKD